MATVLCLGHKERWWQQRHEVPLLPPFAWTKLHLHGSNCSTRTQQVGPAEGVVHQKLRGLAAVEAYSLCATVAGSATVGRIGRVVQLPWATAIDRLTPIRPEN
jgi:hypothetical protein